MPTRSTYSKPALMSAEFNSCWGTAVCLLPPAIFGSLQRRFVPQPARWICCRCLLLIQKSLEAASSMRPALEVADVVRAHGNEFRQAHAASLSARQRRVLRAIESCRTAALGGHLERCDRCGHERNAYNSCSDRHCPKCQSLARAKWLEKRQAEWLPCEYFHVVFTLPEALAAIALQNKSQMYGLLFQATAATCNALPSLPSTWVLRSVSLVSSTPGAKPL